MEQERTGNQRGERGTVMVIAALAMTALLLFAALAIDVGAIWASRTQSQNADDSAALAAAATMVRPDPNDTSGFPKLIVDLGGARTQGRNFAGANATVGEDGVFVADSDFEFGFWDLKTRTLTPCEDETDPDCITGARVRVRMDNAPNKQSPAFLSRLIGIQGFTVRNVATAYQGFEGEFAAGEFELPVAIDSCKISTDGCGGDYCKTIESPPNPCDLRWVQGKNPVTCLDFSSTPAQNACWTNYSPTDSSVNNPVLEEIVDNGSPEDIEAGDEAYMDNGDKTATQGYIRNLFYGCNDQSTNCCITTDPVTGACTARTPLPPSGKAGQEPAGRDRYQPNPIPDLVELYKPGIDSWVVKLPVFECQADRHCSGGGPMEIVGGACFEIREILAPSGDYHDESRIIKGRFLCEHSDDPLERQLYTEFCKDESNPQDSGAGCVGTRVQKVVLVE